ncbi:MAG: hypothetical protein AB9917_01015 [Negativicutes bacterium]
MTNLRWLRRFSLLYMAGLVIWLASTCLAAEPAGINVVLEIPYSLGQKQATVAPGETIHAFFSIENTTAQERKIPIGILLPTGISLSERQENWIASSRQNGQAITKTVALSGGYGQWFDFLTLTVDESLALGVHPIQLVVEGMTKSVVLIVAPPATGVSSRQAPVFEQIVLPLDKDGKRDEKQNGNALVLRDRSLDYFKNVLRGKGASNLEIEAIHPVAHMGLDFSNPAGQQKLVMVEAELLDKNTHRRVPGLYTPGSNADSDGAGAMAANQERLTAFVALTGENRQRLQLPIYADESLLTEGNYLLRVKVEDGETQVWSKETPIVVVKKNMRGLITLGIASLMLLVFLLLIAKRLPFVLAGMKTRRLITIALFGTCAFAVVNVPSTLLNDFFHIFLGPFGFLLTGMFSGVMLYMLTGALITLVPLHGVVTLMATIRLLLGMVAFGHMSPIVLLSYGVNAFLLELALAASGFTSSRMQDTEPMRFTLRRMVMLALACALADTVATYVTMQGMAVLYRLYYADWYIYMVMAVNGFFYTMIGAGCGLLLGSRLADVGSD